MYSRKMNLEDRIVDHLPLNGKVSHPDMFGLEIELEGVGFCDPDLAVSQYWTSINDGSLRKLHPGDQCIEYVLRKPMIWDDTLNAIHAMFEYLTRPGCKVYESYRTSIHVHLNFGLDSFRTVYNFMTLALILDELMVSQNGDHRVGNNFCLRAKDAMGQVIALIDSIESGNNFFNIHGNERYSSINFAALMKYGSIEFRSLECTTHEGRLVHWINTLMRLKAKAKTYKNPVEIISEFSKMGPEAWLKHVLGPFARKYQKVDGYVEMLRCGMRIAQDLAYASSWKEVEDRSELKNMIYKKAYGG